jgi:CubicO group peptidase (beta-lactamase class C family)
MQEALWNPMGAESNAYWFVGSENMEMVYGFLNATARDYAKLGELFRLKGKFNGKQIVPSSWVKSSTTPDAPHLMPGENPLSDFPWVTATNGGFLIVATISLLSELTINLSTFRLKTTP